MRFPAWQTIRTSSFLRAEIISSVGNGITSAPCITGSPQKAIMPLTSELTRNQSGFTLHSVCDPCF